MTNGEHRFQQQMIKLLGDLVNEIKGLRQDLQRQSDLRAVSTLMLDVREPQEAVDELMVVKDLLLSKEVSDEDV